MHFGLTEEQDLLQATFRRFAEEALPPARLRTLFDEGQGFDAELWQGAAEIGLQGLIIPERFGGSGLELLDLALAFEVLGEAAMPGPFLSHALACIALSEGGSEAQKEKWLPRLADGSARATCAFAESGPGAGAGSNQSAPSGGGSLGTGSFGSGFDRNRWTMDASTETQTLSGEKRYCEFPPDTAIVIVGLASGELGLVEVEHAPPKSTAIDSLDRSRPLHHLEWTNAPIQRLEAKPALGDRVMDAGRILLAADAFGGAWRLIRTTTAYALQREQFSTPIAQFQAVKHQLANMAKEVEPMRGLLWYAAYAFDHRPEDAALDAATAKAHLTDRAVQVGRDAVSIHGGIGFTWECDVHFWLKRAMLDRTLLGGPAAERERMADLAGWSAAP